jgi:hypothetical protein
MVSGSDRPSLDPTDLIVDADARIPQVWNQRPYTPVVKRTACRCPSRMRLMHEDTRTTTPRGRYTVGGQRANCRRPSNGHLHFPEHNSSQGPLCLLVGFNVTRQRPDNCSGARRDIRLPGGIRQATRIARGSRRLLVKKARLMSFTGSADEGTPSFAKEESLVSYPLMSATAPVELARTVEREPNLQ